MADQGYPSSAKMEAEHNKRTKDQRETPPEHRTESDEEETTNKQQSTNNEMRATQTGLTRKTSAPGSKTTEDPG